ncbi:chemotaxis protein CheW [Chroococcidiopsis sp. CCALA 051]|uniref:chemotaxis protein CheW n=1 Tax=Chroococcidiopsis sp. CCALA 051 TaxID=869949 RepID=UPI000D0DFEE0|nr:chemotaxis protein CheW [Chroococcidiopsis sp. CCALA 051]MBE9016100.1 purine-binding chemotaxis protein CheW [Chroococcidiopsidales cyanobacterium LEGE 13417]PSM51038.1 chemotaxis protein CheW [Chroococcidiopsis sp. CCALA 051]
METKPYLIFSLHNLRYGIDATLVQEIFLLPELNPIIEAPTDIVGILNLRSQLIPIMHLGLRLGYKMQNCHLSDSVIVLQWQDLQIGIIVNSVYEVKNISSEVIETNISYGRVKESTARFIHSIAKLDADIIMLLDPEQLICSASVEDILPVLNSDSDEIETFGDRPQLKEKEIHLSDRESIHKYSFYDLYYPQVTPQETAIFRERAENLRRQAESSDFTGLIPLAVFGLNDEYFGLDLDVVREFTNICHVTQIPCCPNHIVGNVNLRGEIVTLVDIRQALNLALDRDRTTSKAIVISFNETIAGIPVDEVFDVMYLRPSDLTPVPVAVHSANDEYLRGNAPYLEKMLTVLDLPQLLSKNSLVVDEEI